jgi:hypothetical protein
MSPTNLLARPLPHPPWIAGVIENVDDPSLIPRGTLAAGENLVPERAPRLATRGGSRIVLTLHDDQGTPAELTHVLGGAPKAKTGAVVIGWSDTQDKHYAYALTSDMAFAGASEALSRTVFPAGTGTWQVSSPGRPVFASLFEKLYVSDADPNYSSRKHMVEIDAVIPPGIITQTFDFDPSAGAAAIPKPYCVEEYNNVLFMAGYGDETNPDAPALVRHSFLARSPYAADGFDKDAYNTIGAKDDRVTGMKKGRGLLLVAKANEIYRVSGFGRAYPGWQYQVEGVQNTHGYGIENPLALEQAEGYWYGIGKEGPFRTDGFSVDSLMGPRQSTWQGIDRLDLAWVRYHPERRLVLFGVHVTAGAPDTSYPWVLLAWDTARQVWQPDWKVTGSSVRFFSAVTVASTSAQGPSAGPSAPSTTLIHSQGWTANWTNGDATAETEYWEKDVTGGGSWNLKTTVAAGVATYVVTGRKPTNAYQWRVRHKKNGVFSAYTADQSVTTLAIQIAQPDSDVDNADGWSSAPLYQLLDEYPNHFEDYTQNTVPVSGSKAFTVGLANVTDRSTNVGHIIRARARLAAGTASDSFTVELMQGAVVKATLSTSNLDSTFRDYEYTLTGGQADSITDYTDLRLRVTYALFSGGPATCQVDTVTFEAP